MLSTQARVPRATTPWKKKAFMAGLLCLEIPVGVFFFPLAAVLVLTGILAPLGILSFKVATMPFSRAMRCRTAGQEFALHQPVPDSPQHVGT
ncbi:MAG: hypothetical protein JWM55_1792 [Acidimicrobiaceae bacterium]|nr:hypothetical protein [Acidimicrobiaceae bacterium]